MKSGRVVGGAAIPAVIDTGRRTRSNMAQPIFNASGLTRGVQGGAAQNVIAITRNDIEQYGGQYKLIGGAPVPMEIVADRRSKQGAATVVYPVDIDGNYDYSFATSFLPTDIAGLDLWLAADLGLGLADGSPIATWEDQSGSGNHAVQVNAANRPTYIDDVIYGKPATRYVLNDFLTAPVALNQPYTVCIVGKAAAGGVNQYFTDGNALNTAVVVTTDATHLGMFAGGLFQVVAAPANYNIIIAVFNGGASVLSINNAETVGNPGAGNATELNIGIGGNDVAQPLDGDILELCVYDSALGINDRDGWAEYSSAKYGVSIA